jgi:6-phosphofructokinase 1
MTNILKEEGKDLFDARSASLGHTLQGGTPSPLDRTRAARLTLRCMQFLEEHAVSPSQKTSYKGRNKVPTSNTPQSAASITIQGSQIIFAPVADVLKAADMKNRRGKETRGTSRWTNWVDRRSGIGPDALGIRRRCIRRIKMRIANSNVLDLT